ncbi:MULTISPECIES: M23 family metallopeptidase [unclassified Duganella]|uniref:M23 family metallopeptidase n=1 Tax=unclassified Duganella TaxID=2636909 RepID=UPI000E341922|nr:MULTISPECIES: M23 family metallopeptidase [unclassified Duganella]RFP08682.1 M23 family peptidase [Duganella sp. BJB475]RFP27464.1 M23 family peptidase [Duganella sp. BJB476]
MRPGHLVVPAALALLLACAATGAGAASQAQVEAHALHAPQTVAGSDGVRRLYYELDIGNFYADTGVLKLTEAAVYADGDAKPLATFSGAALAGLLRPNKELEADNSLAIAGGMHALLLIAAPLPDGRKPPHTLRHKLTFKTAKGELQTADDIAVAVDARPPVVLGPPLRGGLWLADEGPGHAQSHHWGSVIAQNGRLTIPQRYAIDFFGLDTQGHAVRTPVEKLAESRVEDWTGWNSDVLAAADGVVRDTRDGLADQKPLSPQEEPAELSARTLYGNFIVLEVQPGVFVHYAHLRQGSVQVKPGQRVKRGALLGHLGLTGAAGAPHLHFHVSDQASFADSQGLPFVFDSYTPAGHSSESEALNSTSTIKLAPQAPKLRRRMPLDGDIVGF